MRRMTSVPATGLEHTTGPGGRSLGRGSGLVHSARALELGDETVAALLDCLGDDVPKIDFDLALVLDTPYHIDRYQDHYFVIRSYDQLYESVTGIEPLLEAYLTQQA